MASRSHVHIPMTGQPMWHMHRFRRRPTQQPSSQRSGRARSPAIHLLFRHPPHSSLPDRSPMIPVRTPYAHREHVCHTLTNRPDPVRHYRRATILPLLQIVVCNTSISKSESQKTRIRKSESQKSESQKVRSESQKVRKVRNQKVRKSLKKVGKSWTVI